MHPRAPLQLVDMGNASSSDTGAAGGGERSGGTQVATDRLPAGLTPCAMHAEDLLACFQVCSQGNRHEDRQIIAEGLLASPSPRSVPSSDCISDKRAQHKRTPLANGIAAHASQKRRAAAFSSSTDPIYWRMKESECVKGQALAQAPELEEAGMSGPRAEVRANSKTALFAHDFSLRQHHLPAGFLSHPGHNCHAHQLVSLWTGCVQNRLLKLSHCRNCSGSSHWI